MIVKGLNDAKYTIMVVYITTIMMFITVVIALTLSDYITAHIVVYAAGLWISATIVLAIVFVPRVR